MKIDFNETECAAMQAFLRGDAVSGAAVQQRFLAELKQSMKAGEDYCPCNADCTIHGKCVICVQVHRGHGNHLPACMHAMLNQKLEQLSALSEHTLVDMIEKPPYLK